MGVTKKLAEFIVDTQYDVFSDDVVRISKELILNGLGAMIAGVHERVSEIAIKHVEDMGGVAEVGVVGGGFKTSLPNAALVGGVSVHAIEQEACGRFAGSPPFAIIPAALSIAEKHRLPGKSVIEGLVLGCEAQGRLGLGCPGGSNRGWSGVYFPIGAAACASKMMNLDVDQTRMALGIATDAIGGSWRHCGYMSHFLLGGIPCQNGVTAALLAKQGLTANPDMLDGEGGFGDWVGEYTPEIVVKDLGNPFYIVSPGLSIKKYNCCFGIHRALDALWDLIWEHDIHYDQVDSVQVEVPKFVTKLIHYDDPQNGEQAKFSLQHAFAVLLVDRLVDGNTTAQSFSDIGAADSKYKEARKKVNVVVIDQPGGRTLVGKEMPVTIRLKNGHTYSKEAPILKGSPESPLSKDAIVGKYRDHVRDFLSPQQVQHTVALVSDLDKLPDILELMEIVTFGYTHSH